MNNTINKEEIKSTIQTIRGKQVILASDLAKLLQIETKNLNKAAKRNLNKFSNGNYFQLVRTEYEEVLSKSRNVSLRFQTGTLNDKENNRGNHIKYLPYAFTKEGVLTLATIFKNEKIREVISIILEIFDNLNIHQIVLKSPELREKSIRAMIYEINGIQVMLDEDLSFLYQCKHGTKEINQAVKNNLDKFPKRYSWILSDDEYTNLRSKILTSSYKNYGGRRYNPRVFTEQGVAMLATALKSNIATKVSIAIMDIFVAMRHSLAQNKDIYQSLNNINNKLDKYDAKFIEYDKKFKEIFNNFTNKDINQLIFFEGQIYDSYSKIIDILNQAKNNLTLIDNYADKTVY